MVCYFTANSTSLIDHKRKSLVERAGFRRSTLNMQKLKEENDLSEYLKALVDMLTEDVYRVVSHAIFSRHKLTFSFMLCVKILMNDQMKRDPETNRPAIEETEWNLFLRGSAIAAIAERLETADTDTSSTQGKR